MSQDTYKPVEREESHSELYRNLLGSIELGSWLSVKQLKAIKTNMRVMKLKLNDELFRFGSDDGYTYFLVSGNLELIAGDGKKHMMSAKSASSYAPVANLRSRRYTVKAATKAKLIRIDDVDLVSTLSCNGVDGDSGFEVEYVDDDSDFWNLLPMSQFENMQQRVVPQEEDEVDDYLRFTY